jgi:CheY-like chemotaxis protein
MGVSGKRILLVEDDQFLRRACETGLRRQGFTIVTAADGEEGLRLAHTGAPDLILLDMLMPKMSGIEVLRALKADEGTRSIPVLVLSNSSQEGSIQQAMALGAIGYLVKANLSLEQLGDRVAKLLEV